MMMMMMMKNKEKTWKWLWLYWWWCCWWRWWWWPCFHDGSVSDANRAVGSDANLAVASDTATTTPPQNHVAHVTVSPTCVQTCPSCAMFNPSWAQVGPKLVPTALSSAQVKFWPQSALVGPSRPASSLCPIPWVGAVLVIQKRKIDTCHRTPSTCGQSIQALLYLWAYSWHLLTSGHATGWRALGSKVGRPTNKWGHQAAAIGDTNPIICRWCCRGTGHSALAEHSCERVGTCHFDESWKNMDG